MAASWWLPFQTVPVCQVTVYGSPRAVATTAPSTVKSTDETPTSSLAFADSEMAPETAAPGSGAESAATGGVTSGPPPTAMQRPSEQRSSSGQSQSLWQAQPAANRSVARATARMVAIHRPFVALRHQAVVGPR